MTGYRNILDKVGRFAEGRERRLVGRSDTSRVTEPASRVSVGPTRFETWIGGLAPRASIAARCMRGGGVRHARIERPGEKRLARFGPKHEWH